MQQKHSKYSLFKYSVAFLIIPLLATVSIKLNSESKELLLRCLVLICMLYVAQFGFLYLDRRSYRLGKFKLGFALERSWRFSIGALFVGSPVSLFIVYQAAQTLILFFKFDPRLSLLIYIFAIISVIFLFDIFLGMIEVLKGNQVTDAKDKDKLLEFVLKTGELSKRIAYQGIVSAVYRWQIEFIFFVFHRDLSTFLEINKEDYGQLENRRSARREQVAAEFLKGTEDILLRNSEDKYRLYQELNRDPNNLDLLRQCFPSRLWRANNRILALWTFVIFLFASLPLLVFLGESPDLVPLKITALVIFFFGIPWGIRFYYRKRNQNFEITFTGIRHSSWKRELQFSEILSIFVSHRDAAAGTTYITLRKRTNDLHKRSLFRYRHKIIWMNFIGYQEEPSLIARKVFSYYHRDPSSFFWN